MTTQPSVVVVGAGLCGLVTGYELQTAGVDCLVLEADNRVGGRVQTLTYADGATAEAHMEEFWQSSPAYALLRRLGLELDEDRAHSSLVIDGTLATYRGEGGRDDYLAGVFDPAGCRAFRAFDATARGLLARLDLAVELRRAVGSGDRAQLVRSDPELADLMRTDLASFVRSTGVPHPVAEWLRIVVESETAVEWDRISALDGLDELRPFLDGPDGFGETNAHVVGGNERFTDALRATLDQGTVATGRRVARIRDLGSHVAVDHHGPDGRVATTCADQVVVTVPWWSLRDVAFEPGLDLATRQALGSLGAGSYVKVLLRLRPEAADLWSGYGDRLFTLLTDGPAGCVYLQGDVLTALVHGPYARAIAGLPPARVVAAVGQSLEALSVRLADGSRHRLMASVTDLVTEAHVFCYPNAVAYWPVRAGRSRFDPLSDAVRSSHGRVHLAGDTTECSHSDGAVRSAQRVAAAVAARLGIPDASAVPAGAVS